jgi:hypothetical protein
VYLGVSAERGVLWVAAGMKNEFAKGTERSEVMHRTVSPPESKPEPGRAVAEPALSYNRRRIDARKTQHRVR